MTNYKVTYQEYDRSSNQSIVIANFKSKSDLQALAVVINKCQYGVELSSKTTEEELVDSINLCNGDGCDYIYRIENVDEDYILFEGCNCDAFDEQNWGECVVEEESN